MFDFDKPLIDEVNRVVADNKYDINDMRQGPRILGEHNRGTYNKDNHYYPKSNHILEELASKVYYNPKETAIIAGIIAGVYTYSHYLSPEARMIRKITKQIKKEKENEFKS